MAFNASSSGIDFEPVPMGLHKAICYIVADIGTHTNPTWGTDQRKVVFVWELPEVRIDIKKDGKPVTVPRFISNTYTVSLSEKANLYAHLTSWRGVKFTPKELEGFDLLTVAGANCQLNIVHATPAEKTYANISAIVPLPKNQWLQSEHPIIKYSIDEHGSDVPDGLPEWVKKQIAASQEFIEQPNSPESQIPEYNPEETSSGSPTSVPDDEVPF